MARADSVLAVCTVRCPFIIVQATRIDGRPVQASVKNNLLFQAFSTNTIMAKGYAKDQPQGFSNRIEKVAIIGVRQGFRAHVFESRVYL